MNILERGGGNHKRIQIFKILLNAAKHLKNLGMICNSSLMNLNNVKHRYNKIEITNPSDGPPCTLSYNSVLQLVLKMMNTIIQCVCVCIFVCVNVCEFNHRERK